jgi:hypothetical protein
VRALFIGQSALNASFIELSRLAAVVILVMLALPLPSYAESPADALKVFGLIGTWSTDCAKDLSEVGAIRRIYESPIFAMPSTTVIQNWGNFTTTRQFAIISATQVTEEKIKIIANWVSGKKVVPGGRSEDESIPSGIHIVRVVLKVANKIRDVDHFFGEAIYAKGGHSYVPYQDNGKTMWRDSGSETPLAEKEDPQRRL